MHNVEALAAPSLASSPLPIVGRVLQVSVSGGGVPKHPVERAWVSRLGLATDAHTQKTQHGGPHRAVCLFGIEAIRRIAEEGNPIAPGTVGENLTTEGIEWSLQPIGTRARIGSTLEIELAASTTPCRTTAGSFVDGRISRMSIQLHPADSRMYARVLREGEVRPGDPIGLLPPSPESAAQAHLLLNRIDRIERTANVRLWTSARAAGTHVRILHDGELSAAASREVPGPAFNAGYGLRLLPHHARRLLRHLDEAGTTGWIHAEDPPWPEARPEFTMAILAAPLDRTATAEPPVGVTIRAVEPDEADQWSGIALADAPSDTQLRALARAAHGLLATPNVHGLIAEAAGQAVGAGVLHVARGVGLLRAGAVMRPWRGRGIQRALIAARVELARTLECDLVAAHAPAASVSERNLRALGLERIRIRHAYRYTPRPAAD